MNGKYIAAFVAAIVLSAPLAFAQAESGAGARTVSSLDLKLRHIGQAFDDFVFGLRAVFTFDASAKADLIKERNAQMVERQNDWLEIKAAAMESIKSGNLSASERREIIASIREEHKALVSEHLRLTSEISSIRIGAKVRADSGLEKKARMDADEIGKSELKRGLDIEAEKAVFVAADSNITADEARAMASSAFGIQELSVTEESMGNTTFFVVTGSKTEGNADHNVTRSLEVWISKDTGTITSASFTARIERNTAASAEIDEDLEAEFDAETESEATVSAAVDLGL